MLELAILGLLHHAPMHGYELRKRLNAMLGAFRAFSYGSLYPALRELSARGLISASDPVDDGGVGLGGKRARIVYRLTEGGHSALESLLGEAGPATWEDENFDVRFAFFAQTDVETRLRILEGRRTRMAERLETLRAAMTRDPDPDPYTSELQRHGLDQVEREVRWLDGLIDAESGQRRARRHSGRAPA
ncbi:MAG: PadR family transcriptional regulator [Bifidobacteriaceae bacterium]|nr:PadR family transcriptional regulator [Bifidobacteriaceae bacterium]